MVVATIDLPTCTATAEEWQVTVVGHFVDGATNLGDKSFTHNLHQNTTAEKTQAIQGLADAINAWKAILTKQQAGTALMSALKTALEAKI